MGAKTLLATAAAGIALGLLMAPKKGTETREDISDAFGKFKDKWGDIKNLKNITAEDLRELKEIFAQNIAGLSEDVRNKILEIIEHARPAKETVREEAI